MVFSSNIFLLIFLPLVLGVYLLLPTKFKNITLLIASLIFYAWGEPIYILIMLFSTVFDYHNGLLLEHFDNVKKPKPRKVVLALSIVINLSLLMFFKYTNFAINTINSVSSLSISTINIVLPIGISFYTFQTLSYTIDVYRRKVKAQHNIVDFSMYICMFPQLIAGPIVKYSDVENQLKNRPQNWDKIYQGIFRFIIGLSKKVIFANQIGEIWNEVHSMNGNTTMVTALIGAVAFSLQIYFDFSGYSDMAIGLGKMFGFDLQENFNYPYESKSITEFWRRWHISLGSWFREYLYIPLGGNRLGLKRQIINLLIVWTLTGLWHGAGWNFIIWGLYFFVFLVLEKTLLNKLLPKIPSLSHIYTILVVMLSWVIFACDDFNVLTNYIKSLFGFNGFIDDTSLYYISTNWIMLLFGAIASTSIIKKIYKRLMLKINNNRQTIINILFCAFLYIACIALLVSDNYNPFLYFRF